MSALASLVRAYERLYERGEAPGFGYARTNVAFSIRIDKEGRPVCAPIDLREPSGNGKKLVGRRMDVPTFLGQRTSGIDPNFLWDKSQYVLGIARSDPKQSAEKLAKDASRALEMHEHFVALHRKYLVKDTDEGLVALLRFLEGWKPEQFDGWPEEMKSENIVFELDGDKRWYLHERPAARELWIKVLAGEPATNAVCLILGERSRIPFSHPPIKGVDDAQSSGAFIVSFNQDAFTSYGHKQGENAPVSEAAAFAYTTALNRFLERAGGHRIQIGDASTVFWADAANAQAAGEAEGIFVALLGAQGIDETVEAKKIGAILEAVREGRPVSDLTPHLPQGVRFFVIGLAPNKARLSIRFYVEDDFVNFTENFAAHFHDLAIEPNPFQFAPAVWKLIYETAVHVPKQGANGKVRWMRPKDSSPPAVLAGELIRSVLTGGRYPRSLLARVIQRVRSERGRVTGARAAICKAVINRDRRLSRFELESDFLRSKEEIPVALDRANANSAYRLGRLFALMERTQMLALPKVNATVRDQFFSAASTTPALVFPLLVRTAMHHASAAQRDQKKRGLAFWLEREMGDVWAGIGPELPRILSLEDQGRFQVGYYHQRYAKKDLSGAENLVAEVETDEADLDVTEERAK